MIETIILPAYPLLDYTARLLDHVLGREPTYGEVANYLAYRFMETAMLPVLPTNTLLSKEVLSLSILDHRVYEAYIFTAADVDFENKKIKGITLEKNEIIKGFFDFPVVIQNRLAVKKEDEREMITP